MKTHRITDHSTDRCARDKRRALGVGLLALALAIIAEWFIFLLWFDGPARERYEVLVHVALPLCIILPLVNYRYFILVPFVAFLPDLARAFGIEIAHSPIVVPLIFLAAFVACAVVSRLKTALIIGYAACAIYASHLIIDSRKYTVIQSVGGYPWNDLVLYTLLLTVLGFVFAQFLSFSEVHNENKGPFLNWPFLN